MDIDGVLADLEGQLVKHLVDKHGERANVNRDMYSLEDRYADMPDVLDDALDFVLDPNSYYGLEPHADGIRFVESLINTDYHVLFLSSRPKAAEGHTVRWLKKHVENYGYSGGARCVSGSKARLILKEMSGLVAFVVDDNPETVEALNAGGVLAYAWGKLWNDGVYPRLAHSPGRDVLIKESENVPQIDFWDKWS
jgi:hypothetical protein